MPPVLSGNHNEDFDSTKIILSQFEMKKKRALWLQKNAEKERESKNKLGENRSNCRWVWNFAEVSKCAGLEGRTRSIILTHPKTYVCSANLLISENNSTIATTLLVGGRK